MRITGLSLTNFRSFSATQKLDFAQVTLLFGPNSVGKSSVLLALFYLQQILEKGQCDPVRIEALGDKHIGGFLNLVNARDQKKEITIRVDFSKSGDIGSTYAEIPDLIDEDLGFTPDSPSADADDISVEFYIGWSEPERTAYVSRCLIWLDEEIIVEATSDSGLKQPVISFINYDHPLLAEAYDIAPQTSLDGMGYVSEFHQAITEPRMTIDSPQGYGVATESGSGRYFHHVPIGYRGKAGALPMLGQRLRTSLSLDSDLHCNRAEEILSDILVAPLDNLLELLSDSLCIGPLRTVPDSLYQPNPYPQQKDWYSGEAAWDTLESTFLTTNEDINHWIGEKAGLDLGYRLVYKIEQGQTRYLSFSGEISTLDDAYALEDAIGDELSITISEEDLAENPDAEQVPLSNDVFRKAKADIGGEIESTLYLQKKEHKYRRIALWDVRNEIEVSASEIGVGVSQLLPLVVAAHTRRKGVIACEQPELHVHPRVQVGVGDLLTQIESDASFLIETHSEHLILRILRRIRESTEGELPESLVRVDPSDISILYMEPSPDGVSVSRIEVDEDGEFVSKWPDGFFSERRKELM